MSAEEVLTAARETNRRLNRRCQLLSAALPEWRAISVATKGQSTGKFYPALMRLALTQAGEETERLKAWMRRARHHEKCRVNYGMAPCDCGRDELLQPADSSLVTGHSSLPQ